MTTDLIRRLKKAQGVGTCLGGDPRHIKGLCAEAAGHLDALQARVNELGRDVSDIELLKNIYRNYCTAAVNRATRAEQERDTLSRVMEDTANELGCSSDNEVILEAIARLRQERDEAYERAAKVADDEAAACSKRSSSEPVGTTDRQRYYTACHSAANIAAAIRRLAAGPEKEENNA